MAVAAPLRPAPLRVRLHSLLVERGGSVTRPRLTAYLGDVLDVDPVAVRDEILAGVDVGLYQLAWHHRRAVLAVELALTEDHALVFRSLVEGSPPA